MVSTESSHALGDLVIELHSEIWDAHRNEHRGLRYYDRLTAPIPDNDDFELHLTTIMFGNEPPQDRFNWPLVPKERLPRRPGKRR